MKTYKLKLTSALVIDGKVVRAGTTVEVPENYAKDFLRRGKAELLEGADEVDSDQLDLSRMNKAQLVEVATAMGIEDAEGKTKAELVQAIEDADKVD